MEYWQFFLQQQGEVSGTGQASGAWLPVKMPQIEVTAGKYGAIARTSLINTDVEIRITYQAMGEKPLLRKFYQRSRRTNAEGVVVILPFTDLKPGTWELDCTGKQIPDTHSQFGNFGWRQRLQIDVLPPVDGTDTQSNFPQWFLTLESENLVVDRGQSLTLAGQINAVNIGSWDSVFPAQLQIQIREPQNSQILLDFRQAVSAESLPVQFSLPIELPSDLQTCLLLGEITLIDAQQQALASQSFQITIDLEKLLSLVKLPGESGDSQPQSNLAVSLLKVPTPELIVPSGKLKAGEALRAMVKLPLDANAIAVKLWLQDCQTRCVVDGPYWLQEFSPHGSDFLEATIDLTVPTNSREIRFGAIAVNPNNQRESHKVTIDRQVSRQN
jgi:hypothetical protein